MKFTPHHYQIIAFEHLFKHKRAALWLPMGMGKTTTCLMYVSARLMYEEIKVLVIAPKQVAKHVWSDDAAKFDEFKHLKIVPIVGAALERRKLLHSKADIHTINYENLQWLVEQNYWPWDTIIADEATHLKSFRIVGGGKRAKVLSKPSWQSERFIELTGTPSPNGLLDLWGQMWFLDKGERLGKTYTGYQNRWFHCGYNGYDYKPFPHSQAEIQSRLSDICMSLDPKDWLDIKAPIISEVPAYLPDSAMKQYKEMEKQFFLEIIEENKVHNIEALNAAAKSMKCLQLANGAVYTDENNNWAKVHDAKMEALDSVIEENSGDNLIVVYHFKSDLLRLQSRYPQGKTLDGNSSRAEAWNKGAIPLLFIHPASAGHGLNLQHGGNKMVIFGHWWDLEKYLQVIERIGPMRQRQAGYDRPVYIYNIVAKNTIDELVVERRTSKREVQDLLLDYARRVK